MFGEEDAGGEPVCFGEEGEFDAGFVRVQGGCGCRLGLRLRLRRETGETAGEVENPFFKTKGCDALDTACLVPCSGWGSDSQRVFAASQCPPPVIVGVTDGGQAGRPHIPSVPLLFPDPSRVSKRYPTLRLVVPMGDREANPMSREQEIAPCAFVLQQRVPVPRDLGRARKRLGIVHLCV